MVDALHRYKGTSMCEIDRASWSTSRILVGLTMTDPRLSWFTIGEFLTLGEFRACDDGSVFIDGHVANVNSFRRVVASMSRPAPWPMQLAPATLRPYLKLMATGTGLAVLDSSQGIETPHSFEDRGLGRPVASYSAAFPIKALDGTFRWQGLRIKGFDVPTF